MQVSIDEMFEELTELTQKAIQFGYALKRLEHYQLKYKPSSNVWNIYECLEHLNLYGDHYLPEIEQALKMSNPNSKNSNYQGSALGNYFVKIIRPVEGKIKKMKTATPMNPIAKELNKGTVDRFIDQQQKLLELLEKSRNHDLKNIKIKTTLSKFIALRLGDTLRFVVYHTERHLVQAGELLHKVGKNVELNMAYVPTEEPTSNH